MKQLTRPKYHNSEIAKTADFENGSLLPLSLLGAFIDGSTRDCENSFILSGLEVVQRVPASMNVTVKQGLAFNKHDGNPLYLPSDAVVSVTASNATLPRIDTLEIRFLETDGAVEQRSFKDSSNGNITYQNVPTQKTISIEIKCLAGTPGSGTAPDAETGWIKLAEVNVGSAVGAIYDTDIVNVSSEVDGETNSGWSAETSSVFRQGSVNELKEWLKDHLLASPSPSVSVHGILQGHTGGFDSDKLDGKHGTEYATAEQGEKADNALPVSSYTPSDVLTKLQSVDGAGSSVDADLLDGRHADYFMPASHVLMIPTSIIVESGSDAVLPSVLAKQSVFCAVKLINLEQSASSFDVLLPGVGQFQWVVMNEGSLIGSGSGSAGAVITSIAVEGTLTLTVVYSRTA